MRRRRPRSRSSAFPPRPERAAAGPGATRPSRCARPACCEALRAAGAARGEPLGPLALPLPRRSRAPAAAQRRGRGLRRARRRRRDDAGPARGLHRRAGRRLHAGGGDVAGARGRTSASPSASSTSTPTPTSTRPTPRPPGTSAGMALSLALGRGPDEVLGGRERRPSLPEHVALVGFRELDPGERPAPRRSGPRAARGGGEGAGNARHRGPGPRRGRTTATGRWSCTSTWT